MTPFAARREAQNAAFLAALERTGNVRLAALELEVHRSTYTKRRSKCPAFAARWDSALDRAHRALAKAGGERLPIASPPPSPAPAHASPARPSRLRTSGGEPYVTRTAGRRLQLRRAPPGRMTAAARSAFLAALAATNNARLAAARSGFAVQTFLHRRRRIEFVREMRVARAIGADRALLARGEERARRAEEAEAQAALAEAAEAQEAALAEAAEAAGRRFVRPWPEGLAVVDALLLIQRENARARGRRPGPRRLRPANDIPIEQVLAEVLALQSAHRRQRHHRQTGRWRYDHE
jgi:hypothetical protein